MATSNPPRTTIPGPGKPRRPLLPQSERFREELTGWTFITPATLIIFVFGLFPIGYAIYMSLHSWVIRRRYTHCLPDYQADWRNVPPLWELDFFNEVLPAFNLTSCFANYTQIIGDWGGLGLFLGGFAVMFGARWLWNRTFKVEQLHVPPPGRPQREPVNPFIRWAFAFVVLVIALYLIVIGWGRMFASGDQDFMQGLIYTFYYAVGSIPIQIGLGLVLAYVLHQNLKGKTIYRMVFFLPYVTPTVASAVIFRTVFSPRETSLANQFVGLFGLEPQRWIGEPQPFVNALFGWNLEGFLAGPSMAMVSVIFLGIWMYTGYNAVILLAGMGGISGDLYEAARVDGANDWHLFRHITLPLLSPITFYLSILGFIGTFQAFNTLYVMRTPLALGTTDTASIVIFDTFFKASKYGVATAQAVLLLLIILAITQFQRSVFEKRVFYG